MYIVMYIFVCLKNIDKKKDNIKFKVVKYMIKYNLDNNRYYIYLSKLNIYVWYIIIWVIIDILYLELVKRYSFLC